MENLILISTLCFLFYCFFLSPNLTWYEVKLKENQINRENIQLEFTTPEGYPSLMYVNDKRVYYYDSSKDIFIQILPQNILDVKLEKHLKLCNSNIITNKLELLIITSNKIFSVNTFGDYVNRDRDKLEILLGLLKCSQKII